MSWHASFGECAALYFRSLGMLTLLPFGEGVFGLVSRNAFSFGLAALLLCGESLPTDTFTSAEPLWIEVPFEFLLGALVALPAALVVEAGHVFGCLFDANRGDSLSSFYDLLHERESSGTGAIFANYIWVVLLFSGVLEMCLGALFESVKRFPSGSLHVSLIEERGSAYVQFLSEILTTAFSVFIPFGMLFLCVDLSCGIISRIIPRMSLEREGFQAKTALGLVLLGSSSMWDLGGMCLRAARPLIAGNP